jgi:acetyl-CoA acetyltransferase
VSTGVAIAGVAESDLGEVEHGLTPLDLMMQAARAALDDCGLKPADVDGLFSASGQLGLPTLDLGAQLGIVPRYTDSTNIGGSSFLAHVNHARAAIGAGLCDVALIAYGSTARSDRATRVRRIEGSPYEDPFKPMLPIAAYALAASRHMHEFGTTREQLAEVAVAARRWAQMNPKAWSRGPLTVADVLAAPMISDPFGVRDCCLVTDGGAAAVVVSAERARALAKPAVHLLGAGEAHTHRHISEMPDLTTTSAVQSGARAFAEAGLTPADVDVVELYDAFTITPVLFLEDLGFCAKGEGGAFVADGRLGPGGALPTDTNGGGLSYCHPGMYGLLLLVEAVRQLRGECGERQVHDAHVALAHGNGGVLSSQVTLLLGDETTV